MTGGPRWLAVPVAAAFLGTSDGALRRALERRATPSADGVIESDLDGVRGRKLGRIWRVWLGTRWTCPHVPASGDGDRAEDDHGQGGGRGCDAPSAPGETGHGRTT